MGNCCVRNEDVARDASIGGGGLGGDRSAVYAAPVRRSTFWERRTARQQRSLEADNSSTVEAIDDSATSEARPAGQPVGDQLPTRWSLEVERVVTLLANLETQRRVDAAVPRPDDDDDWTTANGNLPGLDGAHPAGLDALLQFFLRAGGHRLANDGPDNGYAITRASSMTAPRCSPAELDYISFCIAFSVPRTVSADVECSAVDTGSMQTAIVSCQSTHNDDEAHCAVCMAAFDEGDVLRVLPCLHKFHRQCVDVWLVESSGSCPVCREDPRTLVERGNRFAEASVAHDAVGLGLIEAPPAVPNASTHMSMQGADSSGVDGVDVSIGTQNMPLEVPQHDEPPESMPSSTLQAV